MAISTCSSHAQAYRWTNTTPMSKSRGKKASSSKAQCAKYLCACAGKFAHKMRLALAPRPLPPCNTESIVAARHHVAPDARPDWTLARSRPIPRHSSSVLPQWPASLVPLPFFPFPACTPARPFQAVHGSPPDRDNATGLEHIQSRLLGAVMTAPLDPKGPPQPLLSRPRSTPRFPFA